MSEKVTLVHPNELAEQARWVAIQTHRQLEEVLIEWLIIGAQRVPVHMLADDHVLALCNAQPDASRRHELTALLAEQHAGTLDLGGRIRLNELTQLHLKLLARKPQAAQIAFERNLGPTIQNT